MNKQDSVIRIGLLAFDGAQQSALFGLKDLFDTAPLMSAEKTGRQIATMFIAHGDELPDSLDAVLCPPRLVPGRASVDATTYTWLVAQHGDGAVLCSVCAGAWILAATGLLDGRPATTHWQLTDEMQHAFPDIHFNADQVLVDEGDIITAGGVMAWMDLGLRLVERFLGRSIMVQVARQFLVEPGHREQRYYSSFNPQLGHGNARILRVQHHLLKDYARNHDIQSLATMAGMSARNFQRQFKQMTGHTPISWLQHLRVEKARNALELGTDSFATITWNCGYEDPAAFQKLFQRIVGLGPGEYRRRFGMAGTGDEL